MHTNIALLLIFLILSFNLVGCTRNYILPEEAQEVLWKQVIYNPRDESGCAQPRQSCREVIIQNAQLVPVPPRLQSLNIQEAWCVDWERLVHHPINGDYYRSQEVAFVTRVGQVYEAQSTFGGAIDLDHNGYFDDNTIRVCGTS
jgi:hypothetical protein